jgi:hypothetical protein
MTVTNNPMRVSSRINSPEKLRKFRRHWSGERILKLLESSGGRLGVGWEIGVGKSYNIDDVIQLAIKKGRYDLVVSLSPTRQLIRERRWVENPPAGIKIVNLRPRPKKKCGRKRNRKWRKFEKMGLGLLGRQEICDKCPVVKCFWPDQYGKALRDARVIYATQAHLERSPFSIEQLKNWSRAESILVLIDEVDFVCKPLRRDILFRDIERFNETLMAYTQNFKKTKSLKRWLYLLDLLLKAPTKDLRSDQWKFPAISPGLSIRVQNFGYVMHGDDFKFVAYDLSKFGKSPLQSRERDKNGNISYSIQPFINCDVIIYSGTANHDFLKFRIGKDFSNPFKEYRFEHTKTDWYNISSRLGTRAFFVSNAPQILDFFAQLVTKRIYEGRRPLLIAKKRFIQFCEAELNRRLGDFGSGDIKVVKAGRSTDLSDKKVVPIINYGMVGINRFQDFDCAYCLTGYYVNERIVNSILQDIVASDQRVPIKIKTGGVPRRRKAKVIKYEHRFLDINKLAQMALNQQEMDVVLQAVGRVRPYTKPREVITFQCSDHPRLEYTQEFNNLEEARSYFSIPNRRNYNKSSNKARILEGKRKRWTQAKTAAKLGLNIRTIKRYWR